LITGSKEVQAFTSILLVNAFLFDLRFLMIEAKVMNSKRRKNFQHLNLDVDENSYQANSRYK